MCLKNITTQTNDYPQNDQTLLIYNFIKPNFVKKTNRFFNTSRTLLLEKEKGDSDAVTRVLAGCSCTLKANLHAFFPL